MQRPTSVTVFGILNIVFAALGVFGVIGSAVLLFAVGSSENPVVRIAGENPAYAAWLKLGIPLGLLSCVALLAAGIGLLRLKSWGRQLSIAYAFYAVVMGVASTVLNFFLLVRPLLEEAGQQQGPEAAGAIGGAVGSTVGGCFGLVYPVLLLIFMFRPAVATAFRPVTPPSPPV